jgi:hypothetical protein
MLFAGEYYYPSGGMDDFKCYLDGMDIESALNKLKLFQNKDDWLRFEWAHVYDIESGIKVEIPGKDLADRKLDRYTFFK